MTKRRKDQILQILPDIRPINVYLFFMIMMFQKTSGLILAFLPIMPIIDVEKVEAKIRRQRLGIHGEDSDSESEDSESDITSSENPRPDNTQNRGGTATKGGGPFGGGGGGGTNKKSTDGPKKQKNSKGSKNPKDTSLWKKLWDWLFG